MKKKKSYFTFLEALITLFLLGFMLTTLLFWVKSFSIENIIQEKVQRKKEQEKNLCRHLLRALSKSKDLFFSSQDSNHGNSLIFTFDNGPNLEPLLSDKVLGRIFIDKASATLCLAIWPWIPDKKLTEPCHVTPLMEQVESVEYSFFYPPDPFKKPVSPEEVGKDKPKEGWQELWKKEYNELPYFIKIKISKKDGREILLNYEIRSEPIVCIKTQISQKSSIF